ncbi:MAG TPA: hypothetical protein VFP68_01410 [Burkholderiaceae bacterium]|nr:hypothetical protein [Burkholderiaceae bacterium]
MYKVRIQRIQAVLLPLLVVLCAASLVADQLGNHDIAYWFALCVSVVFGAVSAIWVEWWLFEARRE